MVKPVPLVRVEGPSRERGRAYGRLAGDRIQKSLDIYMPAFAERAGLEWPQVKGLARQFAAKMADFDPDIVVEMEAIAQGAEQEFEAIVALNSRTELLFWAGKRSSESNADGCTSVACLEEATRDGHLLMGQNWDWLPPCRDSVIVLAMKPDIGPAILTLVEAGIVCRIGLNGAGLGVVGNFLQSDQDIGREGIPIAIIRRRILTRERLSLALGDVLRTPRAFSSNHVLAQTPGEAIDLETSPDDAFPLFPEQGILVHSNHFRSLVAQAKLKDTGVIQFPDSLYRDHRVRSALAPKRGSITVTDLQEALRDHYGVPESVCRHVPEKVEKGTICTVASVVMDVTAGKLWAAPGPVCENDYSQYTLE